MPRNGSNIYSIPPGTEGFPDTTIESEKYNTYIHDVELDLNTPRPVVAGGTGSSTADGALASIGAEKASQVVTSYDSHLWKPGSFYSAASATAPPVAGHAFTGYVTSSDPPADPPANLNIVVNARDQNDTIVPGRLYVREKKAGAWGPWTLDGVPPADALPLMDATPAVIGTSMEYAREDHVHPTDTSRASVTDLNDVVTDLNDAVAASVSTFGSQMAYSGMQINGGMEVSQETGGSGTATTDAYICDGWALQYAGTMAVGSYAPFASMVPGFPYRLVLGVNTPQVTMGAGDYAFVYQPIEGFRISRLAWGTSSAQPITISFWSAHHRPGVYSVAVRNGAYNRSYVFPYTQAAADVAQYNTVTVPGDTAGTWATGNTTGMVLTFTVACGATYTTSSPNTWTATGNLAAPGQVNAVAAATDTMNIIGVTVIPGSSGPTAAQSPLIARPYGEELKTCQRYFEWCPYNMRFYAYSAQEIVSVGVRFSSDKRVAPTLSAIANDPSITGIAANNYANGLGNPSFHGCLAYLTATAAGDCYVQGYRFKADARL